MTNASIIDLGSSGRWERVVVSTPWMSPDDDLVTVLSTALGVTTAEIDFIVVTEKVVSIAAGQSIGGSTIRVGRLARFLAERVRPRGNSLALSVPAKMQWVIDEVGTFRILVASLVSAVTRPFGWSGAFYLIAGEKARSVDGLRGAYPDILIPPLTRDLGREWCDRLERHLGAPIAIIDMNDRGGSVRATSPILDRGLVAKIVADNPLRSGRTSTPVATVRRV